MRSSSIKPLVLISIIIVKLFLLPVIGFFVVKAAANLGFLPLDPLFQYVLIIQYVLPPAMNISKSFHTYFYQVISNLQWHSYLFAWVIKKWLIPCLFLPKLFHGIIIYSYHFYWYYISMWLWRYHDSAVWCRHRRVFSNPFVVLWCCSYSTHSLVNIPPMVIILR